MVLSGADWGHISYNPDPNKDPFAKKINALCEIIGGFKPRVLKETAMYDGKNWYVLEGDYRKEYTKAYPDKAKCLSVYNKNIANRSNYSIDDK